jgi:Regulator of chromosome condensation (RCC1) repeat
MSTMNAGRRTGRIPGLRRWAGLPVLATLLAVLAGPGPVAAADPPPIPTILSTSDETACILKSDGSIACWGAVPGPPPAGPFLDVSAGGDWETESVCTLLPSRALSCWGSIGTDVPAGTFRSVSVNNVYACAITTDDVLRCWSNDLAWEWPVPPSGTFSAVSVGPDGTCAIRRDDGTLVCWGADSAKKASLPPGSFKAISRDCAIRDDDRLVCWGSGLPMSPEGTYLDVSVGTGHTCAVTTDGAALCWGSNDWGESEAPSGSFRDVGAGDGYSCGITTDDALVCWGQRAKSPRPVAFIGPLAPWRARRSIPVAWRATELFQPIASYDVRYRRSRWDAYGFGSSHRWLTATTASGGSFVGTPGYSYCFDARARDTGGLQSSWSRWSYSSCTAIPLDDRALTRSGRWTALRDDVFYRGTALRTRTYGATLSLAGVKGDRIAIVATRCPDCGTVKVYAGSRLLSRVSLVADTTVHRSVIRVSFMEPDDQDEWVSGRLTIKVVSTGRSVITDGVAVFKTG